MVCIIIKTVLTVLINVMKSIKEVWKPAVIIMKNIKHYLCQAVLRETYLLFLAVLHLCFTTRQNVNSAGIYKLYSHWLFQLLQKGGGGGGRGLLLEEGL